MIESVNHNLGMHGIGGEPVVGRSPLTAAAKTSFAELLKAGIDEVTRLQADASQAVQDLASGRTEDMAGVMTALEKSEMAFKMLLAIRAKLMDAYEEIKNIQV